MMRLRGWREDSGVTLVELLVTMGLLAVVSALMTMTVITTNKVVRHGDDENRGLADAKIVSERLARDLRDARGIDAGADEHHLVIWIDANSDYLQQTTETVTWELRASSGSAGHFDVLRTVQGSVEVVEARTLVSDIAFRYCLTTVDANCTTSSTAATNRVTTSMTYDALMNGAAKAHVVSFSTRLRNVR